MNLESFKALKWQEQNALIEPALRAVLSEIVEPMPTTYIAYAVSERLGLTGKGAEYHVSQILVRRFGRHYPGFATHDGEESVIYGRPGRRWRWHPQRKAAGLADIL